MPKSEVNANKFMIRGVSVGLISALHVSVQKHTGQEILNDFGRVFVFAPISIHPRTVLIASGGQYVLTAQGGLRAETTIEFFSSNLDIVVTDKGTGRLKAISPGNLTIHAQARSPGGLVITEDSVEVIDNITPILNVRGGQLGMDREMSIFPTGGEEDLLSFADICVDYKWSIGDRLVLSLCYTEHSVSNIGDGKVKGTNSITDMKKWAISSRVYGYDGITGTEVGFAACKSGLSVYAY